MELDAFLSDESDAEQRLLVYRPVRQLLNEELSEGEIVVSKEDLPDGGGDGVLLAEDGQVVASSTLSEIRAWNMQADVDGQTGGEGATRTVPDVVSAASDVRFVTDRVSDPARQKQILIALSRDIEFRAVEAGGGTLRAGFQHLSRVDDEVGTRGLYVRAADAGVDIHLYGVPDWVPRRETGAVLHGGFTGDFRRWWFVVFEPPAGETGHKALVARHEPHNSRWSGFLTEDEERVGEVAEHLRQRM